MKNYKITVSDKATYIIRSNNREAAEELACEWFSERKPDVKVTVTDEEPDYTLNN